MYSDEYVNYSYKLAFMSLGKRVIFIPAQRHPRGHLGAQPSFAHSVCSLALQAYLLREGASGLESKFRRVSLGDCFSWIRNLFQNRH